MGSKAGAGASSAARCVYSCILCARSRTPRSPPAWPSERACARTTHPLAGPSCEGSGAPEPVRAGTARGACRRISGARHAMSPGGTTRWSTAREGGLAPPRASARRGSGAVCRQGSSCEATGRSRGRRVRGPQGEEGSQGTEYPGTVLRLYRLDGTCVCMCHETAHSPQRHPPHGMFESHVPFPPLPAAGRVVNACTPFQPREPTGEIHFCSRCRAHAPPLMALSLLTILHLHPRLC